MKAKLLALATALLIAQPASAIESSIPEACPTIAGLNAGGLTTAEQGPVGWMAYNLKNHFATPQEWTLIVFGLQAEDAEDALMQYKEALPSLKLVEGPKQSDDEKEWGCVYADNKEEPKVMAVTATPPISPLAAAKFVK